LLNDVVTEGTSPNDGEVGIPRHESTLFVVCVKFRAIDTLPFAVYPLPDGRHPPQPSSRLSHEAAHLGRAWACYLWIENPVPRLLNTMLLTLSCDDSSRILKLKERAKSDNVMSSLFMSNSDVLCHHGEAVSGLNTASRQSYLNSSFSFFPLSRPAIVLGNIAVMGSRRDSEPSMHSGYLRAQTCQEDGKSQALPGLQRAQTN
jgi:hypothetical protein